MTEKELMEKKNDLIVRAEEVLNTAKNETRELTDAEAQELAEIRDNVRRIMKTLELKGDFDKMEGAALEKEGLPKNETRSMEERAIEEEKAFADYIRGVVSERANNLTPAEGSGQVLIPTTIANRIIKKVYDICPILERSSKYNIKGTLEIPYYDVDTTTITVAWATEFQELDSNVGKFTNIQLTGYLAGALSLISRSLINNSQFDIVSFVVDQMAYSIRRFIENVLLNGSGSVEGLSTLTNSLTAASATAITADEVIKLKDKIKDVFQNNAIWIMSPNTRTALRLLKDEVGRYLLQDDITSPFGTTLLGKPIYVSDNMPDMGANNTVIYYGDMKGLATKFSEDMNIQVLREKYATQHAIGVVGWLEFDSKVEDAQKIAKLVMGATTPTTEG
jgi:HK97 family phage major capsid protein